MRPLAVTLALSIPCMGSVQPALAATKSTSFAVSVTVPTGCSVNSRLAEQGTVVKSANAVCLPARAQLGVPASNPTVTVTPNVEPGRSRLTIAF